MIFRVIALSFVLLIGIGAVIPFATNSTEASAPKHEYLKKKHKKYKKYSKRWWRAYHNRVRKRRAFAARQRILKLRRIRLANALSPAQKKTPEQKVAATTPSTQISELFKLIEGKIIKVYDGDTIDVETKDGKVYLIRMLGIDAPEMKEDFGNKSQKKLSSLILGKDATVIIRRRDSSERYIGTVYSGGQDINLKQIETGMAGYFQQNGYEPKGDDRRIYQQAEDKARSERNGLWRRQKSIAALWLQR